jgi:transcription elongation factor
MYVGQEIVMTRGHYKDRPAIIREVHGDKCTVTLTDTPGPYDVTIRNVTRKDYRAK